MTRKNIIIILISMICMACGAQSLDRAKKMYSEGKYAEVKPVFEKLVKQSPSNSSYNQWYGVCCYETGDYVNAEKYLMTANKRNIIASYLYLAKMYSEQYRFDESAEMYAGYIEQLRKKKEDTSEYETLMEKARNLHRMQEKAEDVQVIDSIVVFKNDMLDAYRLSDESGSLMMYSDFFKNENDLFSTVYVNQKGDKAYYARPANGLFTVGTVSKMHDASWGDEKTLLPDSKADNNYPFVLSDGVTMYFASKGYGSIGGYDIFVTRYNTANNSFLAPEQMGMPFNSTANDYMMVIDEAKGLGWFVTDRNQPEDKVCVYLFIPDPSRKRIDIEAFKSDEIRRRALLASIQDTWRDGAKGYAELIKKAHAESEEKAAENKQDFIFVVNDKTVCYNMDDIKSHEAKELYSGYLSLYKQIGVLRKKLDDIRFQFTKGNASTREQLKPTILHAENQLYSLMTKAAEQEKKARNAENRNIK